ncbi:hypothetical protein EJB05_57360, partial [Eragrostis curvula]
MAASLCSPRRPAESAGACTLLQPNGLIACGPSGSGRRRAEPCGPGVVRFSVRHEPTTANPMPPHRAGAAAGGDTSAFFAATLVLWAVWVGFEIGVRGRRELAAVAAGFAFFQAANTAVRAAVSRDPLFVNTAVSLLHSSVTSVSSIDSSSLSSPKPSPLFLSLLFTPHAFDVFVDCTKRAVGLVKALDELRKEKRTEDWTVCTLWMLNALIPCWRKGRIVELVLLLLSVAASLVIGDVICLGVSVMSLRGHVGKFFSKVMFILVNQWRNKGLENLFEHDELFGGSWVGAYSALCFSCGYFAYDQLDMLRYRLYSGWIPGILMHHLILLICFTLALYRNVTINYLILTLVCELAIIANSFWVELFADIEQMHGLLSMIFHSGYLAIELSLFRVVGTSTVYILPLNYHYFSAC